MAGDRLLGNAGIKTIETPGVDQHSRIGPCLSCRHRLGRAVGLDHLRTVNPLLVAKAISRWS